MENKKEYVVQFKDSSQISPDDWEVFFRLLKVTDDTTIGEIKKWYASFFVGPPELINMKTIQITELQNV